jgi:hypothetical protein
MSGSCDDLRDIQTLFFFQLQINFSCKPPCLCEGWMVAILLSSKFLMVRACVVAREKVTPVTLVCGRLEEERKTVF